MGLTKSNILLQYAINGLNLMGICVSVYALAVELYKDANPDYKPMCDISEAVSCSKSLMSSYGRGFGLVGPLLGDDHPLNLRNPVFGIAFYFVMAILATSNSVIAAKMLLWLTILSNIFSIYLAYTMYRYIQSVCLVCCALYVINFALLLVAYQRLKIVRELARKKRD